MILYYTTVFVEPPQVAVGKVESSMVGEIVELEGGIVNYSSYGGNRFFELKGRNSSIKVVQFDSEGDLDRRGEVRVRGEVAVYRGELEIIANEIENK